VRRFLKANLAVMCRSAAGPWSSTAAGAARPVAENGCIGSILRRPQRHLAGLPDRLHPLSLPARLNQVSFVHAVSSSRRSHSLCKSRLCPGTSISRSVSIAGENHLALIASANHKRPGYSTLAFGAIAALSCQIKSDSGVPRNLRISYRCVENQPAEHRPSYRCPLLFGGSPGNCRSTNRTTIAKPAFACRHRSLTKFHVR